MSTASKLCGMRPPANDRAAMWYSFDRRMFDCRSTSMICLCVQSKFG